MCGKEKDGVEIREDFVIDGLRWFNRKVLRTPERNNRIVVCSACYESYKKRRKRYLSRQKTYVILGALFALFGIIIAGNKLLAILAGIAIVVVLYLFSLLSYMPEIKADPKADKK